MLLSCRLCRFLETVTGYDCGLVAIVEFWRLGCCAVICTIVRGAFEVLLMTGIAFVKGLLERWGEEAKMPVVYDHTLDFTLYKKVLTVRNTNLENALGELSKLYEDRGMVFYIQNGVIMAHKKMGAAVKNSEKRKHEKSVKTDVKSQN